MQIAQTDAACNVQLVKWNILVIENISYSLSCPLWIPRNCFIKGITVLEKGTWLSNVLTVPI